MSDNNAKDYKIALVSFIDILGFADIVENNECHEVYEILKRFHRFSKPEDKMSLELQEETEAQVLSFSDTVVRINFVHNKQNTKYPYGILFHEIIDLLHIQFELINVGVLIRGGVALENIFVDENMFYGPAIIEAYRQENLSKYPIISIQEQVLDIFEDKETGTFLRDCFNTYEYQVGEVEKLIKRQDGRIFIDYLKNFHYELDNVEDCGVLLQKHKELIRNGLKSQDISVREKHKWLKKYHNEVLKGFNSELFLQETGVPLDSLFMAD